MSGTGDRVAKAFSCIRCFERKVKCDKQNPCANCIKSNVECIFRIPPAPRRKKKRPQDELLLARLKKCEDLLKSKGIDIDSPQSPTMSTAASTDTPVSIPQPGSGFFASPEGDKSGQLLVDHGRSRFIENNLWTSVSNEFQPKEAIAEYSDEEEDIESPIEEGPEFLLGYTPSSNTIQLLHPPPDRIFVLWQAFLDNINPMTKFVHQPTFHQTLVRAASNLENLPKGTEALMFSIYSSAVFSMEDDECEMKFGEPRKTLLARYRHATRKALARARFLGTSDMQVLQAFVLYLLTMREDCDSRTTWTLSGVASRIGQGMGLHRDGTTLGVSPFETEMRRRLWWQISILDFRSAELTGSGRFGDINLSNSQPPSNVDDAEIYPEMKEPPVSHTKATEMIACLLRCEFGYFWKEKIMQKSKITMENLRLASPWETTLEERDANIHELEQRIEEKYLRYCDPSIPIQFLCILIGRAAINSMRLMAHHPRKYANPEEIPLSEREFLWNVSLKLLKSDCMAHASKELQRFMWHSNVFFQWQALVYILNELRTHTLGDEIDQTWEVMEELFLHHRNFITDYRKPLHVAVGSLCLKAYDARETALRKKTNGVFPKVIPEYIQLLREQRRNAAARRTLAAAATEPNKVDAPIEQMPAGKWHDEPSLTTATYNTQQLPVLQGGNRGEPLFPANPSAQVQAQFQTLPADQYLFVSDTSLTQDLAMADMPMDWAQWDDMMQNFEQS